MSETIKTTVIGAIIGAVITTLGSVFIFFLGNSSDQKSNVKVMSEYFDSVDKDMSFEQAVKKVREESNSKDNQIDELNEQIDKLNEENTNLQNKISSTPNFKFENAALISDGLKIQKTVNKSIIVVDNNTYYSEGILNLVLKNKLSYDPDQNAVFYNPKGKKVASETKVDLFDTKVLYDGICYKEYHSTDGESFSMGGNTYNKGFVIYDDHSLFGEGDGYALFDLQGKYSKMTFNVGRTNDYEKEDVMLKVYLNDEYKKEYSLSAQSPPVQLKIDLNYANSMKLEITGGGRVKYGFSNVVLHY